MRPYEWMLQYVCGRPVILQVCSSCKEVMRCACCHNQRSKIKRSTFAALAALGAHRASEGSDAPIIVAHRVAFVMPNCSPSERQTRCELRGNDGICPCIIVCRERRRRKQNAHIQRTAGWVRAMFCTSAILLHFFSAEEMACLSGENDMVRQGSTARDERKGEKWK